VSGGRSEWNNVGTELWYHWNQSSSNEDFDVRCEDLLFPNGDALAIATYSLCPGGLYICSGRITINTTPGPWVHNYGQATLACPHVDLWSTAAHEFRSLGCTKALGSGRGHHVRDHPMRNDLETFAYCT
jgi:hypothetical protein